MGIDSIAFVLFLAAALAVYYGLSEEKKPYVLTAVSFLFVASYDVRGLAFLVGTSLLIWYTGKLLDRVSRSEQDSTLAKKKKHRILVTAVVLLVGCLALLKYISPLAVSFLAPGSGFRLLVPIGISYYTLQAVSYVVDVYWGRVPAEQKYSRILLFTCYFPQILQGPINRYADLSGQIYGKEHPFRGKNLKFGVQLMLWGYFKVSVISDHIVSHVQSAFFGPEQAYGLGAFLGLVLFGIELYCNFSGGIDIVRGVSQCFGIDLPENFTQPFFSRSLGDFWRRWHITLGAWVKDYVFYPFSMSHPVSKMKKKAKKHLPRKWISRITIAAANLVAFLIVGIWHGLGGNYVIWGLYNGLILAFSELMTDVYKKGKTLCHIREDSRGWYVFSVLRTFLVVTLGWATDCAVTASGSLRILGNLFYLNRSNPQILQYGGTSLAVLALGVAVLVTVDVLHEKKISLREKISTWPTGWQMLFWIVFIQLIAILGSYGTSGGFIYANF